MATALANGQPQTSDYDVLCKGILSKRQRGRSLARKKESGKKSSRLKFQRRFCVLKNESFAYYYNEKSEKPKDIFPVKRIKFVKDVAPDTFNKQSGLTNDQHCFQFGDEKEALYLEAQTGEDKKTWMSWLEQVAKVNGNEMLKTYHRGAYGSKNPEEWSCCGYSGQSHEGCFSVSVDTIVHPRQPTRKSSQTDQEELSIVKVPPDSTKRGLRKTHSADCTSSESMPQYHGRMHQSQSFDSAMNKPIFSIREDDHDTSYVYLVRSFNPDTVPSTSTTRQTMTTESDVEEMMLLTYDTIAPKEYHVGGVDKPRSTIQSTDVNASIHKENKSNQEFLEQKNLAHSYKLSDPLTALKLHQHQLISGNQMLHVWDKTPELTLTTSLKLAGQVHSLDTWKDFIAVGSAVIQLIQLNPISDPKRILYIRGRNSPLHSDSPPPRFLVAFAGDGGHLTSAMVGDNIVDIWAPPKDSQEVVLKPKSNIVLDDESIISLTASKDPNESWIVVVTKANGHIKASVWDWKSSISHHNFEISKNQEINNLFLHQNGMYLVIGYGEKIVIQEAQTGNTLYSTTLDETISCLSGNKGGILVGTTGGDVITFSEDNLTQKHKFTNASKASVVAVAAEEGFSRVYIAYSDGGLAVWSDQFNDIDDAQLEGLTSIHKEERQVFDCVLGQQLCSEGILTQRQTFNLSTQESLSFPFKDNDVRVELPPEILNYPNPAFEAAFSPFGPVGPQFLLPEKMIPVSSAVWLCVSPYEKFPSPAILELSHCFTCNNSEDAKLLYFLKAEHKDIKRDKFGKLSITFEKVDQAKSEFSPKKQSGILRDHHFCIYCLAAVSQEEEVVGKINYCLTILKPKLCPTKESTRIYCILHFDLEGCKKLVDKQTPENYEKIEKCLQFKTGRYESSLEIKLNKQKAESCGWVITMESEKQIFAEDVNFFNYRKVDYLEAACKTSDIHKAYPHAYPPRFVIEVSARYAKQYSTIELAFTGAKRDLYTEIQLHPLRCEDDLNQLDGPGLGGDDIQRPTEASAPLKFPNGEDDDLNQFSDGPGLDSDDTQRPIETSAPLQLLNGDWQPDIDESVT